MSKTKIFVILQFVFFSALPVLAQTLETAWVRRYNGQTDSSHVAKAIAVDGSGNVYVTGSTYDSAGLNYTTIKYSPSGDTVWVRAYNGPGSGDDAANDLAVDSNGNVFVTGSSYGSGTLDWATIKYASDGGVEWVRRVARDSFSDNEPSSLVLDKSGNVYVTGYTFTNSSNSYTTVKYNSNGALLWISDYDGPASNDDRASAIAVDDSGYVYVTGVSTGSGTGADYATIKYAPDGATVWVARYSHAPGISADQARAIAVDGSGNAFVTGGSLGSDSTFDYATLKYNSDGTTAWVRRYKGTGNSEDVAHALTLDGAGNVYVTGSSWGSGTLQDFATIKYSSDGDSLWVRRYNRAPVNGTDQGLAMTGDVNGNIYVSGYSTGLTTDWDYTTIQYAPNGDSLWIAHYDGGSNGIDQALAVAVDDIGNVYVTGQSTGDSITKLDYATIKYRFIPPSPLTQDTLVITAYSPVNLVVTDPKLDSIGLDTTGTRPDTIFNTILEGSTYDTTQDVSEPPDGINDDVVTIPNPYVGEYKIRVVPDGEGTYSLGIRIDGSDQVFIAENEVVPETSTTYEYSVLITLKGDVNKDKNRNLSDVIFLVNYVFKGGPAPDPPELGNVNCLGSTPNLADIIYMVNYVFKGGPAPCS